MSYYTPRQHRQARPPAQKSALHHMLDEDERQAEGGRQAEGTGAEGGEEESVRGAHATDLRRDVSLTDCGPRCSLAQLYASPEAKKLEEGGLRGGRGCMAVKDGCSDGRRSSYATPEAAQVCARQKPKSLLCVHVCMCVCVHACTTQHAHTDRTHAHYAYGQTGALGKRDLL